MYVYFIKNPQSNTIKIGKSACPESRLKQLEDETNKVLACYKIHPVKLELLGVIDERAISEHEVHRCFKQLHLGREWFEEHSSIYELIEHFAHVVHSGCVSGSYKHKGYEERLPAYIYISGGSRIACPFDSWIDSNGVIHSSMSSFYGYYNCPKILSKAKIAYCIEEDLTLDHIFDLDNNIGYNSKIKEKISEEDWNLLKGLKLERLYKYNERCIENYNQALKPYKNKAAYVSLEELREKYPAEVK